MLENVRDYAIFSLDLDGKVSTWNPGAERVFGWAADEVVGRHYADRLPESGRKQRPAPTFDRDVVASRPR